MSVIKKKLTLEEWLHYWELNDLTDPEDKKNREKYCRKHNIKHSSFMAGADEVCIFYFPNKTVVCCNGSDKDLEEWRGNFSPYKGIRGFFSSYFNRSPETSNGYHKDYYNTARKIAYEVSKRVDPKLPLVFDGHSRGGLDQLCPYIHHFPNSMAVTICSPRVMLRWREKLLRRRERPPIHHRLYIVRDIVDNVPPAFLGWRHYATTTTKIKGVKGKFNHTAVGEAIKQAIRRRDGK